MIRDRFGEVPELSIELHPCRRSGTTSTTAGRAGGTGRGSAGSGGARGPRPLRAGAASATKRPTRRRRGGSSREVQGDRAEWSKHPVDLDLRCSAILPGQYVATG